MAASYPALRDRLAHLGVLGAPRPGADRVGPGARVDPAAREPAFEIRRRAYSLADLFGRDGPHPGDRDALFLDTETTGLAGGTGTTPFLVGLAYVEEDAVIVEQFFLRRLSGEPAMLDALSDRLGEAGTLVTFNGRRFDWPILEARAIIGRMRLESPAEHHDLMSAARRLWHRPLGTYRLAVIEREALGIDREGDIDSSEIPGLYLHYLRTGDHDLIEPIFKHNLHDVRTLVHLRRRIRRWIEDDEDPPPPVDWEGLGMLRLQAGSEVGAEAALRRALSVEDDAAVRWRIAQRLARILRREARWEDLLVLWEREIGGRGIWRARALIEGAKVYRRLRLFERAVAALREALDVVEWLMLSDTPGAHLLDEVIRERLARLNRPRATGFVPSTPLAHCQSSIIAANRKSRNPTLVP